MQLSIFLISESCFITQSLAQMSDFNILENVEFGQCKDFISKMPVIELKFSH